MPKRKTDPLILTKAQTRLLRMVDRGEIGIASAMDTMEIKFIDSQDNAIINKKVMLALLRKQLVRYSYNDLRMITTKLGIKLAKLAKAREMLLDKPACIVSTINQAPSSKYKNHRGMYR